MIRQCRQCSASFEITDDDLKFYEKVSPVFGGKKYLIPAPTLCQDCRVKDRMIYRNFYHLYNAKSDYSGKSMISMFDKNAPFPVYTIEEWWGDSWNALDFGVEYDFSKSFFEQFYTMSIRVPRMAIMNTSCENSIYSNMSFKSKNCYLVFGNVENEDCYFGHIVWKSKCCFDCLYIYRCENCYMCVDCIDCYNLSNSINSESCSDSDYLVNCQSCTNCFGCMNLKHKSYYIFNKEVSKEEYEKQVKELKKENICNKLSELKETLPFEYMKSVNSEDVTGNYLFNCKNVHFSYDTKNSEDSKYMGTVDKAKNCYDCNFSTNVLENCYNSITINGTNLICCHLAYNNCFNLMYCENCYGCKNCFGCEGLVNKEYCVLNKQYKKEEYEELVPKIIAASNAVGSWGEFFPKNLSPFEYNESIANDYYPSNKEDAINLGFKWKEEENSASKYQGPQYTINNDINFYNDEAKAKELLNSILICEVTGKPYKIIPQELAFYLKQGIPIPRRCPDQRFRDRLALRNPRKLWDRKCMKCEKEIKTTYAPERKEIVYCEECYQREVY